MNSSELTRIALVGSPNSGKTTLFNALTGSRQKTGNYAGVTVEKKEGFVELKKGLSIALLDLPGAYSLDARTPDEAITAAMVKGERGDESAPQAIIAVADATNLERNLYLVLQLRELGLPMVLALTMQDLAHKQGIEVRREELEKRLGVPVVLTSAKKGKGLDQLLGQVQQLLSKGEQDLVKPIQNFKIDNTSANILKRYQEIEDTLKATVHKSNRAKDLTKTIDKIVLNKFLGPFLLLSIFAVVFQLIFSFASVPMDLIEQGIGALQQTARQVVPAGDLQSLLVDGVLAGVGSVVIFLPQILLLFAFLLFFEDSGYMARAAFIMDRLMRKVGLHGRAFIPLLSSFACAVPGIMATRAIENRRDRLITILVSPLMTCSARIPVYALLIAAFVPATPVFGIFTAQGLTMLGLYLFGVVSALAVAFTLKKTILKGESSHFILELPTYKLPSLRNIVLGLWDRAGVFLKRAGTLILGISIALWFLA
ncbi:MAG: ferrous iron transporter B, partial [Bdellovibrionota bacterium]